MSSDFGSNIGDREIKVQKKAIGLPETIKIVLEENDVIPPTGLFLAHNGRGYMIKPGEEVTIPIALKEILDNAVISTPQLDSSSGQVIAYRDRMRYPYRVITSG